MADFLGTPGDDDLHGTDDDDLIQGLGGNDSLHGHGGDDRLEGGEGADLLFAGTGDNELYGGVGDDQYIVNSSLDLAWEEEDEGYDVVSTASSYVLPAGSHIERMTSISWSLNVPLQLTGNEFVNRLEGNISANRLDGGGGADVMVGFGHSDDYVIDDIGDVVIEAANGGTLDRALVRTAEWKLPDGSHVEHIIAERTTVHLTGNELVNIITGSSGDDFLDGRGGADSLNGGGGDDNYVVDNANDHVNEPFSNEYDSVSTSVDYTLPAGSRIERLTAITFAATTPLRLTGNEFANLIEGNEGGNYLDGRGGADSMVGFGGADTFAFTSPLGGGNVDAIADVVAGVDTILLHNAVFTALAPGALPAAAFRLGTAAQDADDRIIYDSVAGFLYYDADGLGGAAAVHFATVTPGVALTASDFEVMAPNIVGTPGDDDLSGTSGPDLIQGLGGNDILRGLAGEDRLEGGTGNDQYVIAKYTGDTGTDIAWEEVNEGYDVVSTSTNYILPTGSHIERLTSVSWALTTPLQLTGNEFVNLIEGNAGNNILDGAGGADRLVGFGGDDRYVVDNAGDVVIEGVSAGYDLVTTTVDYTLTPGSHIDRLNSGLISSSIRLTGNELVNLLQGDSGNNLLDGRGGADTLYGSTGNDQYVVDNAGDVVVETLSAGNDFVSTVVDYQLTAGSHVERLTSISWALTTPLKLTGNELANRIEGNAGANTLDGKGSADILQGFGGADTFAFTLLGAANVDSIVDFAMGVDRIGLGDAAFGDLTAGPLPASAFRLGTAAQDADDRILYDSATGFVYYDADGVGGIAAVQFATVSAGLPLTASDFIVI